MKKSGKIDQVWKPYQVSVPFVHQRQKLSGVEMINGIINKVCFCNCS